MLWGIERFTLITVITTSSPLRTFKQYVKGILTLSFERSTTAWPDEIRTFWRFLVHKSVFEVRLEVCLPKESILLELLQFSTNILLKKDTSIKLRVYERNGLFMNANNILIKKENLLSWGFANATACSWTSNRYLQFAKNDLIKKDTSIKLRVYERNGLFMNSQQISSMR